MSHDLIPQDDFFNDFFKGHLPSAWSDRRNTIQFPKVNISSDNNSVVVTANVP